MPTAMSSFRDEIEKIATSKWRSMLRAGELGGAQRGRLIGSDLLNYEREVAGLDKGTAALAARHGVAVHEPSFRELGQGVGEVLTGKGGAGLESTLNAMGTATVNLGGAGRVMPDGSASIYMLPREVNPISVSSAGVATKLREDPELASRAAYSVAKRHELDEVLEGKRLINKYEGGYPDKYTPIKTPSTVRERLGLLVENLQRRARHLEPSDVITGGFHTSPKVVFNEGGNLAMMPTAVRENFKPLRAADAEVLSGAGYAPDVLAPAKARRKFMGTWEGLATRRLRRRPTGPVADHVEYV